MRSRFLAGAVVLACFSGLAPACALAAGFAVEHRAALRAAHPVRHHAQALRHQHFPRHAIPAQRHARPPHQPVLGAAVVHTFPRPIVPRVLVVPTTSPLVAVPLPSPVVLGPLAFAIDGDTFEAGGVRYRLSGIDTPELDEPRGQAARERLQALLRWGNVTVIPLARDVYGRVVARVLVAGMDVAAILRSEGFAK